MQSVERDAFLGVTFFFVDPEVQSKGLGRALLERAFPLGRGRHRAIFATEDPRALSLYMRFGVRPLPPPAELSQEEKHDTAAEYRKSIEGLSIHEIRERRMNRWRNGERG